MKILLIHCHYRLPGGEDAVFAAERALLEQHGHTVVVYERSNEEAAHGAAKALLPFRAVWNRRAARDVRNIIEQQHIDAVHIHNTLLLLSPAVVRAAKTCGVPVVLTLHNFRLFCPNGILLRDGRVCEDCPHHGLHCALRHRCYRGSRAQTLVVVAAYWLHRVLGTWRGIAITTPTEFDREKLLPITEELANLWEVTFYHRELRDGAAEMLQALKSRGYHLGVISNNASLYNVFRVLEDYGIRGFMEDVTVSSVTGYRKPHPEIFRIALRQMQAKPEMCVYVGDTVSRDIIGPKQVGFAKAVQIRSFLSEQKDVHVAADAAQPDKVIGTLMDLVTWLDQINPELAPAPGA